MTSVTAGRSGVLLREPPSLRAPLFDTTAPTLIFTALLARMALGLERGSYVKSRRRHVKSRQLPPALPAKEIRNQSHFLEASRELPRAILNGFGNEIGSKIESTWSQNIAKMLFEDDVGEGFSFGCVLGFILGQISTNFGTVLG